MNNLIVKQILQQKNIPEEIEKEIVKYLPLPEQEKKKKEMIRKMNILYKDYWYPSCAAAYGRQGRSAAPPSPRKNQNRPPRIRYYKYLRIVHNL